MGSSQSVLGLYITLTLAAPTYLGQTESESHSTVGPAATPAVSSESSHPPERIQAPLMTEGSSGCPRSCLWQAGGKVIGIVGFECRK